MCDYAAIQTASDRRARKNYSCEECGAKIERGQMYHRQESLYHDGWYTVTNCLPCARLWEQVIKARPGEECYEGTLRDWILEYDLDKEIPKEFFSEKWLEECRDRDEYRAKYYGETWRIKTA